MSFAKFGLAERHVELGQSVLGLSLLGLFAKLLNFDLSQLQLLGITLDSANSTQIPGFIGVALIYAFIAFLLARIEGLLEQEYDEEVQETKRRMLKSTKVVVIALLTLPFSIFVYFAPFALGGFSIWLLWPDVWSVVASLSSLISN